MRAPIHRNAGMIGVFVALLAGSACLAEHRVVCCDARATGDNSGSDWANACLCLQDALEVAGADAAIRVAQGTYKPDRRTEAGPDGIRIVASGRRNDTFILLPGVTLEGGYAGSGAAQPDQRDIDAFRTILSGDLVGNDVPLKGHDWQSIYDFVQSGGRSDNSRSVLTISAAGGTPVVDGVIITGGHAGIPDSLHPYGDYSQAWPDVDGAGVFVSAGNPEFIRCTFRLNTACTDKAGAAGGAGVLCINASPSFTECLFQENVAFGAIGTSLGGAIRNINSHPLLTDCSFVDNVAAGFDGQYCGGAIANFASSPTLNNCLFQGNLAVRSKGGALFNYEKSSPILIDCVFAGNLADYGGAICNSDYSSPALTRCTFTGNQAGYGRGGALFNGAACASVVSECLFLGNTAANEGGAVCGSGNPSFANCLFTANGARSGAALFIEGLGDVTVRNCTLSGNLASQNGGAIYAQQSTARVTNSILWSNAPQEVYLENGTAEVAYTTIRGAWAGVGNLHDDPRFVDAIGPDGIRGTMDDDLRLSAGSPCLDAGNTAAVPAAMVADLNGNGRVANGRVDMGAYEFSGPFCFYVDAAGGSDLNPGWTLREAFATIQRGIDAAQEGYTILVVPGVYREDLDFRGKAITVAGLNGAPTLEAPDDYAVSFYSAEGPGSVLKNFVIANSDVGIFIAGSSPTIQNVTIAGNDFGIAAYAGAKPSITNCILWDNRDGDLFGCKAQFSCIRQGLEGQGNISTDPLFADRSRGDYHLMSEKGRHVSAYGLWSFDDRTSPCIDAGDPVMDAQAERMPNGARINIGAFGGTPQASMSRWPLAGDLDQNGTVDFRDLAILADGWLGRLQSPP